MLTTGIIRYIDYSNNTTIYKVELSLLKSPINQASPNDYTVRCTASLPGGLYSAYKEGDKVFVGFVHDQIDQAVIVGKIYETVSDLTYSTGAYFKTLAVEQSGSVTLPENTTINDINYEKLKSCITSIENLQDQVKMENIQGYDEGKKQVLQHDSHGAIKWVNIN